MTPDLNIVLGGIVRTLVAELVPELKTSYASMSAQLMATLLMMASQEADRAAARLVEENEALLALFADGHAHVTNDSLRRDLEAAAAAAPSTLAVSALRERNRTLRGLLVRLHEHIETVDTPSARAIEERIWTELLASTERRRLDLALA